MRHANGLRTRDCLITTQRGEVVSDTLARLAARRQRQQEMFISVEQRRAVVRTLREHRRQSSTPSGRDGHGGVRS